MNSLKKFLKVYHPSLLLSVVLLESSKSSCLCAFGVGGREALTILVRKGARRFYTLRSASRAGEGGGGRQTSGTSLRSAWGIEITHITSGASF